MMARSLAPREQHEIAMTMIGQDHEQFTRVRTYDENGKHHLADVEGVAPVVIADRRCLESISA